METYMIAVYQWKGEDVDFQEGDNESIATVWEIPVVNEIGDAHLSKDLLQLFNFSFDNICLEGLVNPSLVDGQCLL